MSTNGIIIALMVSSAAPVCDVSERGTRPQCCNGLPFYQPPSEPGCDAACLPGDALKQG